MKRITYLWLAASVLAGILVPYSSGQSSSPQDASTLTSNPQEPSLGSYARAVRKDKKQAAAKQFDNDNLPRTDKLSVVGDASQAENTPANPPDETQLQAAGATTETPKITPGQSPEDRQKVFDQWHEKLSTQQAQVNALARQLDLDQREYRVHAAEYYNDPGQRLVNQTQWAKDEADYKQKIANEQTAIDDAKQKLGDLQEDARHSGVPSSVTEAAEQPSETETQQPETAPQQP